MIPLKLKIRNFMCYKDNVPPLLFGDIHTACICGDNGNGKSALIDAMTWALWGQTRAKSDDNLIYSGQNEMEVEFDFALGQQSYRIIRKRSIPKRRESSGRAILELQITNGDSVKPITGDSIAQTQQKIVNILHMDYPTFINSAFLLQGHADEFTLKRPGDRKQVLADILGLSFYDELESRAKDRGREQETKKIQLENAIINISTELAQKPTCETEFEKVQSEYSQITIAVKEQESIRNKMQQEKGLLENKKMQLIQLEEHIRDAEKDLERWKQQVKQHSLRINEYENIITRRSTIEEGYNQLITHKKLNEELEHKFRQLVDLEKQKTYLDGKIREAGQSVITEHALILNKIKEIESNAQKIPQVKAELQKTQIQISQLNTDEEALLRKKQVSQELRMQVHQIEANILQLKQGIKEIAEKLNLLLTEGDAKCPLCGTELSMENIDVIKEKHISDRQSKSDEIVLNQTELTRKKTDFEFLEKEILQMEIKLKRDSVSVQSRLGILKQQYSEAEKASDKLIEERGKLTEIEEQLVKKDFANIEQKALEELEKEIIKIDYNPQQHEKIRKYLADLQQYEDPKRRLEIADRFIYQEKEAYKRAEEAIGELHNGLEIDNQRKIGFGEELNRLPQLVSDLTQIETEYQVLVVQQRQFQEIIWQLKVKLQRCSELEIQRKEKEKLLAQASREEKIYRDLAQAFGKKGVQALLIEMALPEIENEADRLLGRMTDNRMHIKIETQRQTKKGDLLETLDINISDELGTRNYEMFSGGESFRINFAIRIALSKMLAKRAGAPLPILVIDEGFGTQDSTGIEKLKEAINSIKDDFDKILVITHIDEFKDAFSTRIDVIKTPEGSTLEVN
ncbi:MAG: SMC family ATPase [Dehalococcoidales bacterium]|nr:SMC family ATPase [Dehalococcoidales bacterium]